MINISHCIIKGYEDPFRLLDISLYLKINFSLKNIGTVEFLILDIPERIRTLLCDFNTKKKRIQDV